MWGTIRVTDHHPYANRQWSRQRASQSNTRNPGVGTKQPAFYVVTGAARSSPRGPSPRVSPAAPSVANSGGSDIVPRDPVKHRDIPEVTFDQLNSILSDRVSLGLACVVACDLGELRSYTIGTSVTGFWHTVVSLGESSTQWACDHLGLPPRQVEELLHFVGRRNTRTGLLPEVCVAARGAECRQKQQRDRDVCQAD